MRETGATLTGGPLPCYRGVPLTILFCTVDLKALPQVAQWPSTGAGRTGENTMSSTTLRVIREEHGTLAAILRSLRMLAERGPDKEPGTFFDAMRAMLFYIDEFPERQHHPKETELLFPPIAQRAPEVAEAIARLDSEHAGGEAAVRELEHLLLAWELMGESRRATFVEALDRYITFYLEHMRLEETVILPAALKHLSPEDWAAMDAAFASNTDLLATGIRPDPAYERLFSRIVHSAPPPLGMGR